MRTSKKDRMFDIRVDVNFIRTMLLNKIKEATSTTKQEELTEILIGILDDANRLELLLENLMGTREQELHAGDRVFCDYNVTRFREKDGKMVVDQRKNAGVVGWVTIDSFNPFAKTDQYTITFDVTLESGETETRTRSMSYYWFRDVDPDGKPERKGGKS